MNNSRLRILVELLVILAICLIISSLITEHAVVVVVDDETSSSVKLAQCDDGTIVSYDVCAQYENSYPPSIYKFICHGTIYSINNVLQSDTGETFYFYRREP